ncbi:MAG: GrpB family protein [Dehalococcoidales bacterium]|jgi:GrpB-like predicted nucleotidyltransferase (UPF0157 family)
MPHKDNMTVMLVEKYNPLWAAWFKDIKEYLGINVSQSCLRIEHVGSTSIPGMVAKPIIDLILVIEPRDFEKIKTLLAERAYWHQGNLGIPDREAFELLNANTKKPIPKHHLYVCPSNSVELKKETAFRDFLKSSNEYAEKLSKLKWFLAETHNNNRQAYMEGKAALCQEITEIALGKSL